MSNPFSAIRFDVGGRAYEFKLGTYALAVLERKVKMPASAFFKRDEDQWGTDDVLTVFCAGLYRQHKLSEEEVADLIDELGVDRVQAIILGGINAANGPAAEGGNDARPPIAAANGTGIGS